MNTLEHTAGEPSEIADRAVRKIGRRRPRKTYSCESCRDSKLRCDRQSPCANCRRRGLTASCTYQTAAFAARQSRTCEPYTHSAMQEPTAETFDLHPASISIASPSSQLDVAQGVSRQLPIDENEESILNHWDQMLQRPSSGLHSSFLEQNHSDVPHTFGPAIPTAILLTHIPSTECCDYLVSKYFMHLSGLFDILHGPTFQDQYIEFLRDRTSVTLSWLALLFVVCSMSLISAEPNDPIIAKWLAKLQDSQSQDPAALSRSLRSIALTCLAQDEFLVRYDLNTLEALLLLIYSICHTEGVERSWTLLGMALNMGIALKCNKRSTFSNVIDQERRRRCWAGILMLHTYQGMLFRDVDMSYLLNIGMNMPREGHDQEDQREGLTSPFHRPSDQSLMGFKLRLFRLSTQLCCQISKPATSYDASLMQIEERIIAEQEKWDETFLVNGIPSVLDSASYAHWCILQTYAHQLFLLIHRPFHRSCSPHFRPESKEACLKSGRALMDLHGKFCDLPRLRNYRWLVYGMTSFNALQGAVAITSCVLDLSVDADHSAECQALDMMIARLQTLEDCSPICRKVYSVACHLQTYLKNRLDESRTGAFSDSILEDWAGIDWFNFDTYSLLGT
ncbi:hypothetical protein IQ07DRAFT_262293 [Pyrenochaeta sp. DS3sAY3a]|nr:hypothetical protein IQ07DRAFT_262293 [Pyrenochaeta sp. DS3sAY3a]